AETAARMLRHLERLLAGIAANPQQPISALSILPDDERDRLLHAWNNTQADYPRDRCVHHLFAAQAQRTPERVAAVYRPGPGEPQVRQALRELTYRELDQR